MIKIFAAPINYDLDTQYEKEPNEILIGVDKGAVHASNYGLTLDYVLGDFDSITEDEFASLKARVPSLERFKVRKDKTDSDLALTKALSIDKFASITLYGGIGSRLDHTYGNLLMLRRGDITVVTKNQMAKILSPGTHEIYHAYAYISFFALGKVVSLTLKGFSFELEAYDLKEPDPLCISNTGNGTVSFSSGRLLMIASNDE
jgi:thiamine pyrophosphokinase